MGVFPRIFTNFCHNQGDNSLLLFSPCTTCSRPWPRASGTSLLHFLSASSAPSAVWDALLPKNSCKLPAVQMGLRKRPGQPKTFILQITNHSSLKVLAVCPRKQTCCPPDYFAIVGIHTTQSEIELREAVRAELSPLFMPFQTLTAKIQISHLSVNIFQILK